MQRKANLFYIDGPDSNFLTFNNYTEYLTGNILSTNTKLFPSKFMCIYSKYLDFNWLKSNVEDIDSLISQLNSFVDEHKTTNESTTTVNNEETNDEKYVSAVKLIKKIFITIYLTGYYENKLAVLRDDAVKKETNYELSIYPLDYLMYTIISFNNDMKALFNEKDTEESEEENIDIVYVGDITETNYDGNYNDMICIVDTTSIKSGKVVMEEDLDNLDVDDTVTCDSEHLYNWTNIDDEIYSTIKPTLDKNVDSGYRYRRTYKDIEIEDHSSESSVKVSSLTYNLIIPLFDVVNTAVTTAKYIDEEQDKLYISPENDPNVIKNIPLGVWINVYSICLTKDIDTSYYPTWSLSVSAQFRPIPYFNGSLVTKANTTGADGTHINVYNNSIGNNEFTTIGSVLSIQNDIYQKYVELSNQLLALTQKYETLKEYVDNRTNYQIDIDTLEHQRIDFELKEVAKYNELREKVLAIFDNLKWKITI